MQILKQLAPMTPLKMVVEKRGGGEEQRKGRKGKKRITVIMSRCIGKG